MTTPCSRDFIKVGLKSERELYDIIQENIRNGQELEIERDMLRSIIRTCEDSGVKIEEINPRAGSWGGSYRDRMKEIGLAEGYPFFQGMSSQAVHGSWSDLVRNYLNKSETGYEPKADHTQTEGKFFGPTALFATNAAEVYIDRFFDPREAEPLVQRLDDLQRRMALGRKFTSRMGTGTIRSGKATPSNHLKSAAFTCPCCNQKAGILSRSHTERHRSHQ